MKKLLSVLLALVMALGLLATTAWADDTHTHCVCCGNYTGTGHTAHENVNWQPWPAEGGTATSLPTTAGNYYLTQNVTVSNGWTVTADIKLCLNGHTLTGNTGGNDFITVQKDASLTITDCHDGDHAGKITGGYHIISVAGGTFNMYGGEISGRNSGACGSVYVTISASQKGTFNMYGGIITQNTTSRTDYLGGGVYNEGTFNMYGGEISGNTGKNGAGVYNTNEFNMYGGTIKDNSFPEGSSGQGANVYNGTYNNNDIKNFTGNFTFTGGTVEGDIFVKSGTKATIAGGLVDGITSDSTGSSKTVVFDAQGGSAVAAQYYYGEAVVKAVKPADPTREGYRFLGWYNGDSLYNFDNEVTGDLTLTAKWEALPEEPEEDAAPGHTPIRRQNTSTDTTVADTTVTDTTKVDTVTSAKTFDVGSAVYGVMAVASLLGMGYVGKKR